METIFKSARAKLLALAHWLESNARYQNNTMSKNESLDLATYYLEKLDVHSVRRLRYFDSEEDYHEDYYEFRVKVGKPKFRGTVNYTLHEHSLVFNTSRPTNVRLAEDYEWEPWIMNIARAHLGTSYKEAERWHRYNIYSGHPHINEYGEPCLGGWANAWSSCISSGNISSLIPVAQSFLNTWTSNDAYFNINDLYRSYRVLPLHFRKLMPLPEFQSHTHMWYKFSRNQSRRFSAYNFCRWVSRNENAISALVYKEGFDFRKLYHCYSGVVANKNIKHDTECRMKNKLFNGIQTLRSMHQTAYNKVNEALQGAPTKLVEGLVQETMIDKARLYIPAPWSTNPSNMWYSQTYNFEDYVNSQTDRQRRSMRNRTDTPVTIQDIMHFNHNAHKMIRYQNDTYLEPQHIKEGVIYFNVNVEDRDYAFDMFHATNNILTEFGYSQNIVRFDVNGEKYAESIIDALSAMDNMRLNGSQIDEYTNRVAYKALCNYESNLQLVITKRIHNGKDKYKPIISDNGFGNDSQQSQLSLESF